MTAAVTLGVGRLELSAVVRVARHGATVAVAPEARTRVAAAHALVERLVREGRPVYGVTTGTGAGAETAVAPDDLAEFQRRLLLSHSVGVGPPFGTDVARAMLLARAGGLAAGGSGASPEVLDALVALLNAGVHPVVPSRGSVGAADLAPLSHLALPLLGLGKAEYQGEVFPGAEALRRAGLAPVSLGPKDGLALMSSNAAAVGHGALVLWDALEALDALTVGSALSLEGFAGNVSPLDSRVHAARPAPGQAAVATRLRRLLDGSRLWQPGAARRVQDPLSFRCVPQVHGACQATLEAARESVEIELNGAGDNPLVVPEDGVVLSNGNFHVAALALAFDAAGLGLAQVAGLAAQRVGRLLSAGFSGLPPSLSPRGCGRTGFATLEKTLIALVAEVRHLSNPASLDFVPLAEGQEDHATMAPLAVGKTERIVGYLRSVAAIELLVGAQAVDLRGARALGRGTRAAYQVVRAVVPALDEDRILGPDVERVAALVASGDLVAGVRRALAEDVSSAGAGR